MRQCWQPSLSKPPAGQTAALAVVPAGSFFSARAGDWAPKGLAAGDQLCMAHIAGSNLPQNQLKRVQVVDLPRLDVLPPSRTWDWFGLRAGPSQVCARTRQSTNSDRPSLSLSGESHMGLPNWRVSAARLHGRAFQAGCPCQAPQRRGRGLEVRRRPAEDSHSARHPGVGGVG